MADREKLIKLLYKAPCESDLEVRPGSCPYRKYGRCGEVDRLDYCAVQRLSDHLIANGVVISNSETTTKWIPVTERLPEESGEYLAYCGEYDGICILYCDVLKTKIKWRTKWKEVTHWMPLPEPPKGE